MKRIRIDVVVVPLSGHLYPTMNLLVPLLNNPQYEIRLFTGPQKREVTEAAGFTVVSILENHIEEFERVANNDQQLGFLSAYHQLSASIDLINLVSDQLLEEWSKNRPDIVIADFITLSGGLVANQLGIPWITTMATQFVLESKYPSAFTSYPKPFKIVSMVLKLSDTEPSFTTSRVSTIVML